MATVIVKAWLADNPLSSVTSRTTAFRPTSALAGVPERVVIVEEIYEIRGIRYAKIKVNDNTFDKLKAGSEFAEVFRLTEIKDDQTVLILCGDETYELKVDQLRKI